MFENRATDLVVFAVGHGLGKASVDKALEALQEAYERGKERGSVIPAAKVKKVNQRVPSSEAATIEEAE